MVYTEAAQTVVAEMTKMAEETEESTATMTPEAEVTATPDGGLATSTEPSDDGQKEQEATPTEKQQEPTSSGPCTLSADYVADVTYPDDTVVSLGETFTKTWQVLNSGSCTWGSGYTVYYVSGDDLSAPEGTSLTNGIDVPEGTMINVSITLTAPTEEGTYRADFKFKDPSGDTFGAVYVQIFVRKPTPEPSNTPEATLTPLPSETPTEEPTATPEP